MPGRGDSAPTAAELLARLVVAEAPPMHGRFRCVGGMHVGLFSTRGSRPYVVGTPDGARFVVSGDRIRVYDDTGPLRVSDGTRTVVRDPDQGLVEVPRVVVGLGPERHLLPDVHLPWPRLRPPAEPGFVVTPTTWEGRRCWSIAGDRWTDVVDDETSVVWRYEQRDDAGVLTGWAELVDLDLTTPIVDADLTVPGAAAWVPPPERTGHGETPRTPEVWAARPVPTLTWTPYGLPHVPLDGDVDTGWLVTQVRCLMPDGAVFLQLHRRPVGVDAPLPDGGHRWHADGCDWVLVSAHVDEGTRPPDAGELAAMAASVDTASPWPRR